VQITVELPDDMSLTRDTLQEGLAQALSFKGAEPAEAALARIRTMVEMIQAVEGAYEGRLAALEEKARKEQEAAGAQ
jgi:hypothetical protein